MHIVSNELASLWIRDPEQKSIQGNISLHCRVIFPLISFTGTVEGLIWVLHTFKQSSTDFIKIQMHSWENISNLFILQCMYKILDKVSLYLQTWMSTAFCLRKVWSIFFFFYVSGMFVFNFWYGVVPYCTVVS